MDDPTLNSSEASKEAVHATRDAAQKIEVARQIQTVEAANAAANRVTQNIGDIMQDRIEYVLARGTEQEKSIILARVPFICQDIKSINKSLDNIEKMMAGFKNDLEVREEKSDRRYVNQDQFWPIRTLSYGFAGLLLAGVITALLALVLSKS